MNLSETEGEYIKNIVRDFEHCGESGGCESCKCYERMNGTDCTFCELLLIYRNDISKALTNLIDQM